MPQINIEYDDSKLTQEEIITLSQEIQKIVSQATGIKDVFVYSNTAQIKVQIAPIEIFVRMSAHIMNGNNSLMEDIKLEITNWKKEAEFSHSINLTLIPMNWQIEIGL
ncbi:MAG: hypothetical protein LAT82_03960 [Nanoarchaeota archaeon]|nr:hypothetical protein [Nanoarchaeota archaeon]